VPRPGHAAAVHSVALSKDGRYALTGGADKTLRLWDLTSKPPGQLFRTFEGHQATVTRVLFSPDGSRALSTGDDWTGRLWDVGKGKELQRVEANAEGQITGVAFDRLSGSPLAARILAGGDATALLDLSGKELQRFSVKGLGGAVLRAAPSAGGRQFASTTNFGTIYLWDVEKRGKPSVAPADPQTTPSFSPDGNYLLWGTPDGTVRRWAVKDAATQAPLVFSGHTKAITSVATSPDNKLLAASAIDGKVIVWDTATRKVRQEWQLPGAVHGVAFDEQGRHLALANANGTAFILRLAPAPETPPSEPRP
jgi:WD40 repeat protein